MSTLSVEPNERVTFKVRHEDEDLLVVEKPARVVTLPGVGHEHDTLLNGLFARYGVRLQNLGKDRDFGMVHRLDRETSGLLAVALSPRAYDAMRRAFELREVRKFYWAVSHKPPREPSGVINRPIIEEMRRENRYSSVRVARVSSKGKPSLTAYRVLQHNPLAALIEARAVTGRLHQVRVHLASIGAAILGDELYGPRSIEGASARLALHAHRLSLTHPVTGEPIDVRSPFPKDLRSLLRRLELSRPDLERGSDDSAHELGSGAVGEEKSPG